MILTIKCNDLEVIYKRSVSQRLCYLNTEGKILAKKNNFFLSSMYATIKLQYFQIARLHITLDLLNKRVKNKEFTASN